MWRTGIGMPLFLAGVAAKHCEEQRLTLETAESYSDWGWPGRLPAVCEPGEDRRFVAIAVAVACRGERRQNVDTAAKTVQKNSRRAAFCRTRIAGTRASQGRWNAPACV